MLSFYNWVVTGKVFNSGFGFACSFFSRIWHIYLSCCNMRSQYAWYYHGDAVAIQVGKIGDNSRVMLHTLPALWKRCREKGADAPDVGIVDSPLRKKTKPNEQMPRSKEQQVLADRVAATLEKLRHASGDTLPAERKRIFVDLLEAAALDVLDALQTAEDLYSIREVIAKAEEALVIGTAV